MFLLESSERLVFMVLQIVSLLNMVLQVLLESPEEGLFCAVKLIDILLGVVEVDIVCWRINIDLDIRSTVFLSHRLVALNIDRV